MNRFLPAILASGALMLTSAGLAATVSAPPPADPPTMSLAPMIKRISPAVVSVAVRGAVREQQRNPFFDDPFFRRFFGEPQGRDESRERPFQSAGSGVVVDAKNGYIVTNAHVVENAKDITIATIDDRELKAEVVGADKGSDVAVLKIKDGRLSGEITLADSGRVEVGDFVVAIGNPFGLQHTVTSGIVSALGRTGINPEGYENFIQTDAAINPGNSGGALVNLRGELVGINTAIFSRSGGNMGIGFAIPSNMVRSVMDQLIKFGEVKRGQLGVSIVTLTPKDRQSFKIGDDVQGAMVAQVMEGSAAAKAGIEAGDIITAVNGEQVKSAAELRSRIGLMRVGEQVDISLLRDGKQRRVAAVIRESAPDSADAESLHASLAGADLTDAGTESKVQGVLVRSVAPQSPAAQTGLRANDIIIAIDRARVDSLAQLRQAVDGLDGFWLTVRRGTQTLLLPVR
ncbi:MAG: Do family serine endopeptidase [Steroidobacteraceae bacterium]